ncbi:DUF1579 family protein [Allosphingosinicella flava]|uniref:DUF1579 family protein n=1 Tax=Allosphingosinicella flava TaxID=2771430 RepID=A0A7T2GLF1_9SPHN|nr:DUF1579 family protein [Sphingosinicella flava]QPQ56026.1 DUF1579 family protein [Sphingosinicella flava]
MMRTYLLAATALIFAAQANAAVQEAAKPAQAAAAPVKPKINQGQIKYNSIFPVNTPDSVLEPMLAEVGTWDADIELYVGDPANQPIRKKGVQTNRMVSSGRYMLNEMKYLDGTYEGTGLWGWDAFTNRYTGVWMDGSHYLVRHDIGYYNPDNHTFRWESDTMQPDGVTTRFRITQQFMGDKRTFQMDTMDAKTGEFRKLIFMTFTKRKA